MAAPHHHCACGIRVARASLPVVISPTPPATSVHAEPPRRLSFWEWYAGERLTADQYAAVHAKSGRPRVCATLIPGRCGSTLLASLVSQWECAGRGNEVFNEWPADRWQTRASTAAGFLDQALRAQQSGGVFWFQCTPQRYDHLVSGLDAAIPATWRLSAILRRDIVSQAMSYVYAIGSGVWHSTNPGHDPTVPLRLAGELDWLADRVLLWIERLVGIEVRIRELLERQPGAAPLVLFYEEIVHDPQAAARHFCRDCGAVPPERPEPFRETISRLVKDGEAALRERVHERHGDAVGRLEQDRTAGVLAWAESLPGRPAAD